MKSFRNHMISYLEKAQEKNPSFSLRALAKMLDVNPSYLANIKSGKKDPSQKIMKNFSLLSRIPMKSFSEWPREQDTAVGNFKNQKKDPEQIFSDEQHFLFSHPLTIMFMNLLFNLPRITEIEIAEYLQRPLEEIKDFLHELQEKKLIQWDEEEGLWITYTQFYGSALQKENTILREINKRYLEQALWGLEPKNVGLEDRDFRSLTFMCPQEKIQEFKSGLRAFILDFSNQIEKNTDLSHSMYRLTWQMLPIVQPSKKRVYL